MHFFHEMDQYSIITIPDHLQALSKQLFQLQQDGVLCDTCLVCKDGVILIHKLILLSCGSLYFQQQVSSFNATSGGEQCQVMLKEFTTKCVSSFVEGLYTGHVTLLKNSEQELLDLTKFLGVSSFVIAIAGALGRRKLGDKINKTAIDLKQVKGHLDVLDKNANSDRFDNMVGFKEEPDELDRDEQGNHGNISSNDWSLKQEAPILTDSCNTLSPDMYMYTIPEVNSNERPDKIINTGNSVSSHEEATAPTNTSKKEGTVTSSTQEGATTTCTSTQEGATTTCTSTQEGATTTCTSTQEVDSTCTSPRYQINTRRRLAVMLKDFNKDMNDVKKEIPQASARKRKTQPRMLFEDSSEDDNEADEIDERKASKSIKHNSSDDEWRMEDEKPMKKKTYKGTKKMLMKKGRKEKLSGSSMVPTKIGEGRFLCDICGKRYSCTKNLRRHKLVHNGSRPYMCAVCCKTFKTEEKYKNHASKHSGERLFECPHCDKKFKRRTALDRHIRIHTGEKPYMCEECGSQFSQTSNLKLHMKTVHTDFRPRNHRCDVCGTGFYSSQNLTDHMRCHSDARPYKCKVCGKTFKYRNPLRQHMMKHTGERPHKCKFCGRGFIASDHLAKHLRIHTDERPFECEYCGRCFRCKANLTRHTIMHTGNYPYRCDVCGKGFARKNYIQKHLLEHSSSQHPLQIGRRTESNRSQLVERHSTQKAQNESKEFLDNQLVGNPDNRNSALLETEIQSAIVNILDPSRPCAFQCLY